MQRRQARPVRPWVDRSVSVDGRTYRVKIRRRFAPARASNPILFAREEDKLFRWLFWTVPARLIRYLTDRDGWTVTVYEAGRGPRWRCERRVHSERTSGPTEAAERADALVEEIEDRSLA
jgi:hypothetical protein